MSSCISIPLPVFTEGTSSPDSSTTPCETYSFLSPLEEESSPEGTLNAYWTLARTRLQSTPKRLEDLNSLTILRVTTVHRPLWSRLKPSESLEAGKPTQTTAEKKRVLTRLGGHTKRWKGELGKF